VIGDQQKSINDLQSRLAHLDSILRTQEDPKDKIDSLHALITQFKADQAVKAQLIASLES
jgi:hypothetical protein